jgi:NitT/TauT family transport system substrate-binding protein
MRLRRSVPLLAFALALAACAPTQSPSSSASLRPITLLLGFQPDVQFAPFYLAQQAGYYAEAGLDVTIQYKSDADLVRLVGNGQAQFGVTDATDVMISRTAGIPIKYVATLYSLFPVELIGPAGTVPAVPAELAAKRIGTPGKYGSSWHALLALLDAGGLTANDVTIREYPQFNQVQGLLNGDVDLITGFRNNEPWRLASQGMNVEVMTVEQIAPLPGPGMIVGDALLSSDPAVVEAFAAATVRAQATITGDIRKGLDAAIVAVPTIATDKATALTVLRATIELWRGSAGGPTGEIDHAVWAKGYVTMRKLGFIDGSVPLDDMISQVLNRRG